MALIPTPSFELAQTRTVGAHGCWDYLAGVPASSNVGFALGEPRNGRARPKNGRGENSENSENRRAKSQHRRGMQVGPKQPPVPEKRRQSVPARPITRFRQTGARSGAALCSLGAHRMAAWSPGTRRTRIRKRYRHCGQRPIQPRSRSSSILRSICTLI